MAKIVCIFALAAFIQVANAALNCYTCENDNCLDKNKWTVVNNCGRTAGPQNVAACLKHVYTDRNTNKDVTLRKCIIAEKKPDGSPTYKCLDQPAGPTVLCDYCTGDLCNSASTVSFSFVTVLGVVAAFFIPKLL